jgi:ATP-dependent helicase IRC3
MLTHQVGRGLRLSPETNKENCHLIDLVDNITRSGGLAVDPTLLGLRYEDGVSEDPEDDGGTDDYGDEPPSSTNARNSQGATVKKVTLVDIDDPFGLNVRGKTAVAAMSPNAWVSCVISRIEIWWLTNR